MNNPVSNANRDLTIIKLKQKSSFSIPTRDHHYINDWSQTNESHQADSPRCEFCNLDLKLYNTPM
jgi:hypothetical protein